MEIGLGTERQRQRRIDKDNEKDKDKNKTNAKNKAKDKRQHKRQVQDRTLSLMFLRELGGLLVGRPCSAAHYLAVLL